MPGAPPGRAAGWNALVLRANRANLALLARPPRRGSDRPAVLRDPERTGDRAARPHRARKQGADHDRLGRQPCLARDAAQWGLAAVRPTPTRKPEARQL